MTHTFESVEKFFANLGATDYIQSYYPPKRYYDPARACYDIVSRVFSVHYFKDGREIGYWIPDLAEWNGPHVLETPRDWPEGFEYQLTCIFG